MTATVVAPRPTRRDAVRNRERILKAASSVFADQGLDASMDAVAATAGVGVGTVYRHFPRREQLIEALFDDRVDEVVQLVHRADADPDAWRGLTTLIEQAIELEIGDRALSQVLADPDLSHRFLRRGSEDLQPAVASMMNRAKAAGALRADAASTDFVLVKNMVVDVANATKAVAPDAWRRMLGLCLAGLAHTDHQDLPGPALTKEQAANVRGCGPGPR